MYFAGHPVPDPIKMIIQEFTIGKILRFTQEDYSIIVKTCFWDVNHDYYDCEQLIWIWDKDTGVLLQETACVFNGQDYRVSVLYEKIWNKDSELCSIFCCNGFLNVNRYIEKSSMEFFNPELRFLKAKRRARRFESECLHYYIGCEHAYRNERYTGRLPSLSLKNDVVPLYLQYEGEWQNGKPNGRGSYYECPAYEDPPKDGNYSDYYKTYEGEVAGNRHGYGIQYDRLKIVYKGNWVDGLRHGRGIEYDKYRNK